MKKNERGFSLIEVLVALAILGLVAVAFLGGLATANKAMFIADKRTTAESLARTEMEYIKNQPYAVSYDPSIPDDYTDAGYSATIDVDELEIGLQKITVTVSLDESEVIILEDYKVDR